MRKDNITIQRIYIEDSRFLTFVCYFFSPVYSLLADVGDIKATSKIKVWSASLSNRRFYGFCRSMIYCYFHWCSSHLFMQSIMSFAMFSLLSVCSVS